MKSYLFLILFAFTLVSAASAFADDQPAQPTLKAQTHCPVMGGRIDSTVYTDIQGQRVYHCCPGCQAKLVADPDKYFKKAAEQGIVFENIQSACPVSGKPIDTLVVSFHDGRRIYFADTAAQKKFGKDPAKYLAVLDKQPHPKKETPVHKAEDHTSGAH